MIFTGIFFLAYWFILCPVIWANESYSPEVNRSWHSPWLYGYWLVSAFVWIIVFFLAYSYYKRKNLKNRCDNTETECSSEFLLVLNRTPSTSAPETIPLSVQMQMHQMVQVYRENESSASCQIAETEIGLSLEKIQPPSTYTPSVYMARSTDPILLEEDVPWFNKSVSRCSTFRSQTPHVPNPILITDDQGSISPPKHLHPVAQPDSGHPDEQDELEFERAEACLDPETFRSYYQLTPSVTPCSSPECSPPVLIEPLSKSFDAVDMDTFFKEIDFLHKIERELRTPSDILD